MAADPAYTIKDIIDAVTIDIDDGITPAVISYQLAGAPEGMKYLFDNYDVLVIVGKPPTIPERHIQDVPIYYPSDFPISVLITDKFDATDVLISTGNAMMWKMVEALRTIIAANAQVGAYTLRIISEKINNRWVAGLFIWETIITVEYKEA